MAHEGFHEPVDRLSADTMDFHRAVQSLIEELEAVDWYNQRVDACVDPQLRSILAHNRTRMDPPPQPAVRQGIA